jgi:Tfp pilus assembly protein PilF
VIVSKIYLNLGIIASSQEKPSESVHYLERALDFLQRENPTEMTPEFQNIYVLLGMSLTRKGSAGAACESYHKALNISKTVYGDDSEETAYAMIQHAEALTAIGRDTAA